jgi:hypothetical protein
MSVTLDEGALTFLLENPAGPIGRDLLRRSENIVREARVDAAGIIHTGFPIWQDIGYSIVSGEDGLESLIGFANPQDGESDTLSDYLIKKDQNEGKPFTSAVERAFHA